MKIYKNIKKYIYIFNPCLGFTKAENRCCRQSVWCWWRSMWSILMRLCGYTQDKSEDYSLFKLTALASSALTEVNSPRCRLWPQCVVNSGEMRLQWLSTRHHFHCVSSIFSLIYFCSRTIAFHSLCALLCLWVSLRLNLFSSPLFMAVKGAIRYLWLFVLKSLALSDSAPFGDDKLGRHIAAVIGPNRSRRLHLLSKMKTAHTNNSSTGNSKAPFATLLPAFFLFPSKGTYNIIQSFLHQTQSRFSLSCQYVCKSISVGTVKVLKDIM